MISKNTGDDCSEKASKAARDVISQTEIERFAKEQLR